MSERKTTIFDVNERGHHIVALQGRKRLQLFVDENESDFKLIGDSKPLEFKTDDNVTIVVKDVGIGYALCVNDVQIAQYGNTR